MVSAIGVIGGGSAQASGSPTRIQVIQAKFGSRRDRARGGPPAAFKRSRPRMVSLGVEFVLKMPQKLKFGAWRRPRRPLLGEVEAGPPGDKEELV